MFIRRLQPNAAWKEGSLFGRAFHRVFHGSRHDVDMVDGPIFPNLVRFTIPLMLSSILQLLYNMADIVVVGRFESTDAMASVGATSALINLMINLFLGLSIGTSVLVAQHYGANRYRDVQDTVHTSVSLSLVMGVGVGIFGLIMSRTFLEWMGTPEGKVLDDAAMYMRIYFLGMPANMAYNFGAAILRAIGDTKHPLYYLALSGLVNVALNLLLVIVFGMGVSGVAVATIMSQYISAVLVLLNLIRSHGSVHLNLKKLRICRDKVLGILKVGLPAGLQGTIFSVSNVLIQSSVNSFGTNAMAGNTAASNLENFVYIAMNSIYQAALSFTGQNVGARKYERINKILRTSLLSTLVVGVVLGGLATLFSRSLLTVFIDVSHDPEVVRQVLDYGKLRMSIICTTYFLCGLMDVLVGMLRGMGNSLTPMIVSIIGVCCVRVMWIYTVFAAHRTLQMLYISYPVSWGATAAVHFGCYVLVHRKLLKNAAQQGQIQVGVT